MKKPILKGERIVLRPIEVKDAPNYVKWFRDKEVMLHMNHVAYRVNLENEKKFIKDLVKSNDQLTFAIFNEEGKHIGGTGLKLNRLDKSADFGIIIGDKIQWGKGYAGECIKLLRDYLFKKLKFERMSLCKDLGNVKARKAYIKAGFKKEGMLRKSSYSKITKKYRDQVIMSILKEEWLKKYK